jgi:RND family efflux transporter MFP subunit
VKTVEFSRRPRGWALGLMITSGVLAGITLSGCKDMTQEADAHPSEQAPRFVRVHTVEDIGGMTTHRFSGRIEAVQTVDLSFQVGGRLIVLPVKEGQVVKKGSVIARLDTTDYARAVREAEVSLKLARQNYARTEKLTHKKVAAQRLLDEARALRDLASVALDHARQNLNYTQIKAPFNALVTRRMVDPFTNVGTGVPVMRIQDVSEVHIDVDVPETLMATTPRERIYDMAAEFQAVPGVRFPLEYREHTSEPDPVTQTYRVTLAMEKTDTLNVMPGMTASVFVTIDKPANGGLHVPVAAVAADEKKAFFVWIMDEKAGSVTKRPVEIGPIGTKGVPVLSGLKSGEKVVSAGVQRLHEGMRVQIAKPI